MRHRRSQDGRPIYALCDDVDGQRRTYLLRAGLNRVGSLPESDVCLTVRGVSKRHALLVVDGDALSLDDLASKNGTFKNGERLETAVVEPGDRLRFGPAALRLERLAARDGELAIALEGGDEAGPLPPPLLETSRILPPVRPEGTVDWSEVIESYAERLPAAGGEIAPALGFLARALDASGAAVLERSGREPAVRTSVGADADTPPGGALRCARRLWENGARTAAAAGEDGSPWALAARTAPSGEGLALVVWGDFPLRERCGSLLRIALVLARGTRPPTGGDGGGTAGTLRFPRGFVRGESDVMEALYERLSAVAGSDLPILVLGETGTGKEGIARLIHGSSKRRKGPFVAINCAAIPGELLEAELFGIVRGVATGVEGRPGKIEQAAGGTFFLDEIGDMPVDLQSKLLRALQEREIHPVGGGPRPMDVRVVAATNADLLHRVENGAFRRDLYYRLAGFVVRVPALRERRSDIPALIERFLRTASEEAGKTIRGLTLEALRRLAERPWPGNVRELEYEVRRLVCLCPESQPITSALLSEPPGAADRDEVPGLDFREAPSLDLAAIERRAVAEALARTGGNRSRAAALLGVSREAVRRRIARHGL